MTTILKLSLKVTPQRPQKIEMFDLKNEKGQTLFKTQTTHTSEFTDCFEQMSPMLDQCDNWLKL